jgi:hypothetical protein
MTKYSSFVLPPQTPSETSENITRLQDMTFQCNRFGNLNSREPRYGDLQVVVTRSTEQEVVGAPSADDSIRHPNPVKRDNGTMEALSKSFQRKQ